MKQWNDKEKAFVEELTALLKKHGVRVVEYDDYDNDDSPCGSHCTLEGDGIWIPITSIPD